MIDIGGIEVVSTGSRILTAEDVTEVTAHIERLESENAMLRELASVLAHCAADSGCDSCPINGGCARVGELDLCETVHDRMRELGVDE